MLAAFNERRIFRARRGPSRGNHVHDRAGRLASPCPFFGCRPHLSDRPAIRYLRRPRVRHPSALFCDPRRATSSCRSGRPGCRTFRPRSCSSPAAATTTRWTASLNSSYGRPGRGITGRGLGNSDRAKERASGDPKPRRGAFRLSIQPMGSSPSEIGSRASPSRPASASPNPPIFRLDLGGKASMDC